MISGDHLFGPSRHASLVPGSSLEPFWAGSKSGKHRTFGANIAHDPKGNPFHTLDPITTVGCGEGQLLRPRVRIPIARNEHEGQKRADDDKVRPDASSKGTGKNSEDRAFDSHFGCAIIPCAWEQFLLRSALRLWRFSGFL